MDAALTQQWVRLYRLPTASVRFDSTSVSVYHDPAAAIATLLHHGHSKDHRPDLRQFKAMLSSLDALGLPLVCQPVSGPRADDGLYVPRYDATVTAVGTAVVDAKAWAAHRERLGWQVTRRPTTERVRSVFVELTLVSLQTSYTTPCCVTPRLEYYRMASYNNAEQGEWLLSCSMFFASKGRTARSWQPSPWVGW